MPWRLGSIFNDLPGALSSSSSAQADLRLHQKDNVYRLQVNEPTPWLLIKTIFYHAEVLDSEWQSKKMYQQLVIMELLSADGEVNTEPVERKDFGKHIMTKTAFIPQFKTKLVISLLFWWAEETQRLKKLVEERGELLEVVKTVPDAMNEQGVPAKLLLDHLQKRILTRPSERLNGEDEIVVQPNDRQHAAGERPPVYQR